MKTARCSQADDRRADKAISGCIGAPSISDTSHTHVWSQPAESAGASLVGHLLVESVSEDEGQRHQLLGLAGGRW